MSRRDQAEQLRQGKLKKTPILWCLYASILTVAIMMAAAAFWPILNAYIKDSPTPGKLDMTNVIGFLAMSVALGAVGIITFRKDLGVQAGEDGLLLPTWFGRENLLWEDILAASYRQAGGAYGSLVLKTSLGERQVSLVQFKSPRAFVLLIEECAPWAVTWPPLVEPQKRSPVHGRKPG